MTMQVIAHQELTSSQSSITFSSIPQTGTDLLLLLSLRTNSTTDIDDPIALTLNGSSSNFSYRNLTGSGTLAESTNSTTNRLRIDSATNASTSNTFTNAAVTFVNYAGSTNKSISMDAVNENNTTNNYYGGAIQAMLWSNTAAITSIGLAPIEGTAFVAGTSATLYKITKGSDGTTTVS